MAKDELIGKALKAGLNKRKAPAKGKKPSAGASAVLQGAINAAPTNTFKPKNEDGGFFDTPVVKGILDALSTGVYSAANFADFATAGKDKKDQILKEGFDAIGRGDMLGGALDIIGSSIPGGAVGAGVAKGLSAGLGGNHNDANTFANTVVNLQTNAGIDPNSQESKVVQGIGGFAGDVLLDPLNAVPLTPAVKFLKGAGAGAREFKAASALSKKTGEALPDYIAPTKFQNAKKVGDEELFKYRKAKYDEQQAKDAAKLLKKTDGSDEAKAKFLVENVHVLRKGVYKALAKTMDDPAVLATKVMESGNKDEMLDALIKGDDVIPDEIVDAADIVPNVAPHLGDIKKLSVEQKLADEVGKMRTTNRKPIYSPEVAANVQKLREVKAEKGRKVTDKEYLKLGIREEHIPMMRAGTKVENVINEISSGDIRHITRDIRKGVIPETALKGLYEITGTTNPTEVAKFIDTAVKSDSFKEAAKEIGKYGTHRTGETPLPYLGVSGHGKLAVPGKGFTPADIRASMFASNPDDARKFLESNYQFHATNLARNTRGAELRVIADDIFHKVIGDQRMEAGPNRSKRGASVSEDLNNAKWETRWNTHSNLFRISEVTKRIGSLNIRKGSDYDDAWMQVMADIDNRLRLAGIDSHLSNMKMYGDKLVVRLAPSDVFGLMTKTDRIKYIHGNLRHSKTTIKEYLPSTILDMAEVLVRSATKLNPDGTIDVNHMILTAMATLNGRFTKVNPGAREIGRNLDVFSYNKSNYEVLQAIDRKLETDYAKQFKAANSQLDKIRILEMVKQSDPADFRQFSQERLTDIPRKMFADLTKGLNKNGSESNFLTALINTNMRNASVFGGSVAKEIGEASAEYTAKVLNALETGTAGDFLSELVIRPPFSSADAAARAIISDNQKLVQRSVATEGEIKAANALNNNVKGQGSPASNNGAAFMREDALDAEIGKADLKTVNPEKIFDLTQRELNKDMIFRMFGPRRHFDRSAGLRHTYEEVVGSAHAASLIMTGMHAVIRNWRARGIPSEELRVAMLSLKTEGAEISPLAMEVKQLMDRLFDPSKNNFLTRNHVGPEHFNRILKDVGFDDRYRVNPDATPEEMMNVWKEWDITHVEDFISKLTGAMVKTAEDVSVGSAISARFGQSMPGPGMVKITDAKGKNPLYPLIDQSLYYPQYVADEFVHIGRLMTEARGLKPGTMLYTFVTKIMDPIISSLKMTQTTMKPGHHLMSIIGDMWRNGLALAQLGINDPRKQLNLYFESARILKANLGSIRELDELEKFKRLQDITTDIKIRDDGTGSEYFANVAGGGRINRTKLYEMMQAYGVALPAHLGGMAEDFVTHFDEMHIAGKTGNIAVDTVGKVTAGLDRMANPLSGKYSLNSFTAHRDTWTRGVIFLGAMRSKKFRSIEEAAEFAAGQVKKWSPTALDLGAFEAKVARRMVFYYTWIRGMVPRIIESALMTPGVATIPNKLAYNIAVANGVDPMSIGDPFPEGEMFPNWYTERVIGPQYEVDGDLWGANPTGPLGDIMNSLGSNVKPKDFLTPDAFTKTAGTFLNMSNPFFKAPWELTTGRNIESGAPIPDKLQYLQDMVGPARTASKAIGKDLYLMPGENGLTMPNRTEKKYSRGLEGSIFEPGSETNQNALPELLNWATGLNFTNYTSDSAQNSAYYQQRDERQKVRKLEERLGG